MTPLEIQAHWTRPHDPYALRRPLSGPYLYDRLLFNDTHSDVVWLSRDEFDEIVDLVAPPDPHFGPPKLLFGKRIIIRDTFDTETWLADYWERRAQRPKVTLYHWDVT